MAELTSNSTASSKGESKMEKTDTFKSVGSLTFRIDNFREFSNSPPGEASMRHSDAKLNLRGLTFGLAVYTQDYTTMGRCMETILKCENTSGCDMKGDGSWSCLASVTLRTKTSIKSLEEEFVLKFTHKFFSSKDESKLDWEQGYPIDFHHLMDPKYGLYNEKEDTLELIAEISVDPPVGVMDLLMTDIIQVNGETVMVNKKLLAVHSRYFHNIFYNAQFDEGQSGEYKLQIEAPATVEHFKRMLATMYPENRPLDDQCIEGVLHLANQFLVTDVEGKCLEFLMEYSTKPVLFKYRIAHKYGYAVLKDHVLNNMEPEDFRMTMFKGNLAEYVQLGPDAAEAFMARYDKRFPRLILDLEERKHQSQNLE